MKSKLINLGRIFLPLIGGSIVGFIIKDYINYDDLVKPILSPPSIVFPIMWTIIYLLLGISYYIYRKNNDINYLYYIQLGTNYLWSIFFFICKWYLFSSIWIVLLLSELIIMLIDFYKKSKPSFYLNIIYLLWVIFATYLTIQIYVLN